MNDSKKILIGVIIFLVIITFPIWFNLAGGAAAGSAPVLEKASAGNGECVMDVEYMRSSHMGLLNKWRDAVVREGRRVHVAPNGAKYNMSLSKTCFKCHVSRDNFCNKCHSYMRVDPYCWNCHILPEETQP